MKTVAITARRVDEAELSALQYRSDLVRRGRWWRGAGGVAGKSAAELSAATDERESQGSHRIYRLDGAAVRASTRRLRRRTLAVERNGVMPTHEQ